MDLAVELMPKENEMDELQELKSLGLSYLEKNNFKEAVNIYKQILSEYPSDIESYLLLGDLYLANEDYPSAEKLYEKALSLEPDNVIIQRRVKLSSLELHSHTTEEIPTDSESVARLLQSLTGRQSQVTDEEIQKAASLLATIIHAQNPGEMVAKNLDQIDNLLPALIELNIRQARFDRRFDLVNLLQALQEDISVLREESVNSVEKSTHNNTFEVVSTSLQNVEFLVPNQNSLSARMNGFSAILRKKGIHVEISSNEVPTPTGFTPDLVVAFNPHINPEIMEKLAIYSAHHLPIVVDLDDDFEYMPINHPNYTTLGLGSLTKSRSYNASMIFANLITVPGESMAAHIRESGFNVEVVPFGWSLQNEQWQKNIARRSTINIGLIGIQGNYEDVQKYRRIIVRVFREFPQTKLVVCGDPITYKLFENISENRRVFLPQVPDEDMPYILGQMDILLVPLNITPYNLVTSDRLLLLAGVKGIPWIASPMPDFLKWQAGGVTAENPDEWHSYLREFIQDREIRISLGQAGKNRALQREESKVCEEWFKIINNLHNTKKLVE